MVSKSTFSALSLVHGDGCYYLRKDRILGLFLLDPYSPLPYSSGLSLSRQEALRLALPFVLVVACLTRCEQAHEQGERVRSRSDDEFTFDMARHDTEHRNDSPDRSEVRACSRFTTVDSFELR